MTRRRCAIYTRKSSEEGLEQDFNSLDAQRAACEAYIKSQAGEGWVACKARYDDGGISGATLERPGLKALLRDLDQGKIEIVVVSKVDRLTRALTDFAKLVERFDARDVSFVSVTQQFNTTSSMGRLTLNVLLSFAQFEREVTAERIRDKIAASKKKGLWMGGVVPLGYDVADRKLIVNTEEADTVRTLFRLYLELGSVVQLKAEADRLGLKTKARKPKGGTRQGGLPFTRGHLHNLLRNSLYIGEIAHKEQRYQGEHQAIIDLATWDAVQAQLKENAPCRQCSANVPSRSLLLGLLYDDDGHLMKPSHAVKAGRRYRYYISKPKNEAAASPSPVWRLPARTIEEVVSDAVVKFLREKHRLVDALKLETQAPDRLARMLKGAGALAEDIGSESNHLRDVVSRVDLEPTHVRTTLNAKTLLARVGGGDPEDSTVVLSEPIQLKKRGVETKLVLAEGSAGKGTFDPTLIRLVAQAHCWFEDLKSGRAKSNQDLIARHGVDHADVARVLPLALLAPDIIEDILAGRQPVDLTATRLKRMTDLPLSWPEQRDILGFS